LVVITDIVFKMATQREPHDCSAGLYNKAEVRLRSYFEKECMDALNQSHTISHLAFCDQWGRRWKQCIYAVNGIRRMFDRLNKYYVPSNDKLILTEMGFATFKEVCYNGSQEHLKDSVLHFFEVDRNGGTIDRNVVKDAVQLYIRLGQSLETEAKAHQSDDLFLYKLHLEEPLLQATKDYYNVESRKWLTQMSIPEYLAKVEDVFENEMERVNNMLHAETSRPTITAVLRQSLLQDHLPTVIEDNVSGLNVILAELDNSDDLSRLYRLYKDVDGCVNGIAKEFQNHVGSLGFAAVERAQSEEKANQKNLTLITKIIELHERFHNICTGPFERDRILIKALQTSFENFINATHYVTRYLAKYTHQFMMKGGSSEGLESSEKSDVMKHIQKIYGYIRDKDVFEREFQLYLAARLLSNKSSSNAMEAEMIGLLKAQSGYFWAEKLEQMFKDISMSKDIMKDFRKSLVNQGYELSFDLQMNICEHGKWPESFNQTVMKQISPPAPIADVWDHFKRYYVNKNTGRKVVARWDKGGGQVMVLFNAKKNIRKLLICQSTYQLLILLHFNNQNTKGKRMWKYSELRDILNIPEDDLQACLIPLVNPNVGVLQKRPMNRSFKDGDILRINPGIKHPNKRISVPIPRKKKKTEDPDKLPKEIVNQRRIQTDAAIVRIMKARRDSLQTALIAEVVLQLSAQFTPETKSIRRRIEALIEQEYLERDEDERNFLTYQA